MDELIGLLPLLVIYLLAAFSGSRKKKKRRGEARPAKRKRTKDAPARSEPVQLSFQSAFAGMADAACENRPMHLHEATPQEMDEADEGEDPCHAGGATAVHEESGAQPQPSELAQEVLRGVIMGEILTRPCERYARAAMRRNRRGYHGQ